MPEREGLQMPIPSFSTARSYTRSHSSADPPFKDQQVCCYICVSVCFFASFCPYSQWSRPLPPFCLLQIHASLTFSLLFPPPLTIAILRACSEVATPMRERARVLQKIAWYSSYRTDPRSREIPEERGRQRQMWKCVKKYEREGKWNWRKGGKKNGQD